MCILRIDYAVHLSFQNHREIPMEPYGGGKDWYRVSKGTIEGILCDWWVEVWIFNVTPKWKLYLQTEYKFSNGVVTIFSVVLTFMSHRLFHLPHVNTFYLGKFLWISIEYIGLQCYKSICLPSSPKMWSCIEVVCGSHCYIISSYVRQTYEQIILDCDLPLQHHAFSP